MTRWLGKMLRAAACAAVWLPLAAMAHKPSDAYLQLQVNGNTVDQRFDVALRDLERDLALDDNDDGVLDWREVRTRWADIAALAAQNVSVSADGKPCTAAATGTPMLEEHSDGNYAVLTSRWTCPQAVRALSVGYTMFKQTDPTHRGIVRIQQAGKSLAAVLEPGAAPQVFALGDSGSTAGGAGGTSAAMAGGAAVAAGAGAAAASGLFSGFLGFVPEGVHHILIGSDHILFLLALLLPALVMRRHKPGHESGTEWQPAASLKPVLLDVLRVVTAFTVAHSITLALAAFDIVNPPSRWVESIIAASVVLAALNNLYPVFREGRWKLTFVFGLVHGFGFASALKDLGLTKGALVGPLLGFNVGVELGQLAIVAVFITLAWKLRGTGFYRRGLLQGGSVLIALLAFGWLIERAFNMKLPLPL